MIRFDTLLAVVENPPASPPVYVVCAHFLLPHVLITNDTRGGFMVLPMSNSSLEIQDMPDAEDLHKPLCSLDAKKISDPGVTTIKWYRARTLTGRDRVQAAMPDSAKIGC
jgi:hypothetical protein